MPADSKDSLPGPLSVPEIDSLINKIGEMEKKLADIKSTPKPPRPSRFDIETTTSQIAGTFHVNHESRSNGNLQPVTRNLVMHKSRLFGASHWVQGASLVSFPL